MMKVENSNKKREFPHEVSNDSSAFSIPGDNSNVMAFDLPFIILYNISGSWVGPYRHVALE